MNIKEALSSGRRELSRSREPEVDARILLEYVLNVNHAYLISNGDRQINHSEKTRYGSLLARAKNGEPIPYITGRAYFFDLELVVTPSVLIPRPETERLVEMAAQWARQRYGNDGTLSVVDIGTGSGCIALAMAKQLPAAKILATDISPSALELAQENAMRLDLADRVIFRQGEHLDPVVSQPELIVSNMPYIADHEWSTLDDGVKWYEPVIALRGGPDGLDSIREILTQASKQIAVGGAIFLEIGWQQGQSAGMLARSIFPGSRVDVLPDLAGHDRILRIDTSLPTARSE